jgi:tRNA (guanine-N7-)-methyltransferase
MGRRALRKIDPSLDLSRHFRREDDLPRPFALHEFFASPAAPLEVEVGTGKGLFLSNAAARVPEHNFLGIELADRYAQYAASRLARPNLPNGVVISGDAVKLFHEWIPGDCLAAVHVYFPDPWWKMRHRKRRVMNEQMVRDIERTLLPGGTLHFWSDVEEYFHSTVELLAASTTLIGPRQVAERPAEHHLDYHTHFERRKRLDGLPIYRSEYQKRTAH